MVLKCYAAQCGNNACNASLFKLPKTLQGDNLRNVLDKLGISTESYLIKSFRICDQHWTHDSVVKTGKGGGIKKLGDNPKLLELQNYNYQPNRSQQDELTFSLFKEDFLTRLDLSNWEHKVRLYFLKSGVLFSTRSSLDYSRRSVSLFTYVQQRWYIS